MYISSNGEIKTGRPSRTENKEMFLEFWDGVNFDKRFRFAILGKRGGGQYTDKQKNYAFELIRKSGVRATARILEIPRRTLQRWCRKYHVRVKRCPDWVYDWAERRLRRRVFWAKRGYGKIENYKAIQKAINDLLPFMWAFVKEMQKNRNNA